MEERAFDVIPFEDIQGDWRKLGAGSFGNVYKGTYLGIDVAIKEVLPSNDYDVAKYFEREWRLMKEARHPNVVLYLGLSRAPHPDGRIFIISEFIENGNLRMYIHDKSKPFPWRLRISFATDIARALAYLHARKCIHRDLKGENLLVTSNGRLKITDFGFARIAARNAEESKRLTFCGTDSYMSPEILLGNEFDLPTDVFSLGIIYAEILARSLADDRVFKRSAPDFGIDKDEVRKRANTGCPEAFISLTIDCLADEPSQRPTLVQILARLRDIELEVLSRKEEGEGDLHVGSIKFMTGQKRPAVPRIPSFGMGVGKDIRKSINSEGSRSSDEDSDEEIAIEAIKGLELDDGHWSEVTTGHQPLLQTTSSRLNDSTPTASHYSTSVVKKTPSHVLQNTTKTIPPSLSSILTIKAPLEPTSSPSSNGALPVTNSTASIASVASVASAASFASIESYHTAASSISSAAATEGGSTLRTTPSGFVHRFTLIKPGMRKTNNNNNHNHNVQSPAKINQGTTNTNGTNGITSDHIINSNGYAGPSTPTSVLSSPSGGESWSPFEFFFSSNLVAKCDICTKRLGWKPVLECDDCGLRTHIKCGELAPSDCGIRPVRQRQTKDHNNNNNLNNINFNGNLKFITGLSGSPSPKKNLYA